MIALVYDPSEQVADFTRIDGLNLDTDEGLETAVLISMFTDARAKDSDAVEGDKRGWWGNAYLDPAGELGSRLWLVTRSNLTTASLKLVESYCVEALQWMITKKIAASVVATASRMDGQRNVGLATVKITRPIKTAPRFERAWKVQFGG